MKIVIARSDGRVAAKQHIETERRGNPLEQTIDCYWRLPRAYGARNDIQEVGTNQTILAGEE